jgi:hypothetical protein
MKTSRQSAFLWTIAVILMIAFAIGFNVWLNAGCKPTGAITWQGKVCVNVE